MKYLFLIIMISLFLNPFNLSSNGKFTQNNLLLNTLISQSPDKTIGKILFNPLNQKLFMVKNNLQDIIINYSSNTDNFEITFDTLWVQSDNNWSGILLTWNDDLSMWVSTISSLDSDNNIQTCIFTPDYKSSWHTGGVSPEAIDFLSNGTPLYSTGAEPIRTLGVSAVDECNIMVGEKSYGPFLAGTGDFEVSNNRNHWAKVIGLDSGYAVLYDGEIISETHTRIDVIKFDPFSGDLFYVFFDGEKCELVSLNKGSLCRYDHISKNIFFHQGNVFCEVGEGEWSGNHWTGIMNIAKNGEPIIDEWLANMQFFGLNQGIPYYYFKDQNMFWCGYGDDIFGPYKDLAKPISNLDGNFYYLASDEFNNSSVYTNGYKTSDENYIRISLFDMPSFDGEYQCICPQGVAFIGLDRSQNNYIVYNDLKYEIIDNAYPPIVSENGEHLAWIIKKQNNKFQVVVDGINQNYLSDDIFPITFQFSESGNHLAYICDTDIGPMVILDDRPICGPFVAQEEAGGFGYTYSDMYLSDEKFCIIGIQRNIERKLNLVKITVEFNP